MRIVVEDDFNDNSFNARLWTKYEDNNGVCVEENNRIELKKDGATIHQGAGFYSNPVPHQGIYIVEARFQTKMEAFENGQCGLFIRRYTNYGRDTVYYGAPTNGVWFHYGGPCNGWSETNVKEVGVYYDTQDDWHGAWATELDLNVGSIIAENTYYDLKIIYNGTNGDLSMSVDGTEVLSVSLNETQLDWMNGGDEQIVFEFYDGFYDNQRDHWYDSAKIMNLVSGKPVFV